MVGEFRVGDRVHVRPEFRREGDFTEAVSTAIDPADGTIDVADEDGDWGRWFCRLADGRDEIARLDAADAREGCA